MKERDSNLELLRIVAMLMVVLLHFTGLAQGLPQPLSHSGVSWTVWDWCKTFFESLAIICVNLFVLISGYFGIRLTGKKLIHYVGMCAFYAFLIGGIIYIFHPEMCIWYYLESDILFFSFGGIWFIREFLFLMLLSPLINAGLENISRRTMTLLVVSLLVINCYFGWYQKRSVNPDGYSLMQLIFIYVLGRWSRGLRIRRGFCLAMYLLFFAGIFTSALYMPSDRCYAYNSIFVVAASFFLFLFFSQLNFRSRGVNAVARHVFAVLVIHINYHVFPLFIQPMVDRCLLLSNIFYRMMAIGGCVLLVFMVCVLVDIPRHRLFAWLEKRLSRPAMG